jgi:hypothetical protein
VSSSSLSCDLHAGLIFPFPQHSTSTSLFSSPRFTTAISSYNIYIMFQIALSVLLQLALFSLAAAAPLTTEGHNHGIQWQHGVGGGVVGFIVLVLDIIVFRTSPSPVIAIFRTGISLYVNLQSKADVTCIIVEVLPSNRPVLNKVLWCLLVFFFPIGGMIIYWLFSNRTAHRSGGYEVIG